MGLEMDERTGNASAVRAARWFQRPPRWVFHIILIVPTVVLLIAASVPGTMFFLSILALWVFVIGALLWLVRVVLYASARVRGRAGGSAIWCFVAPVAGCVVLLLLVTDAPLRLRWAGSHSDFARAVEDAPFAVDRHLGSYEVTSAVRAGNGVLFWEANGAFLDYAGFAYLPDGPESLRGNGGLESPEFTSLGGGWYAWTASW